MPSSLSLRRTSFALAARLLDLWRGWDDDDEGRPRAEAALLAFLVLILPYPRTRPFAIIWVANIGERDPASLLARPLAGLQRLLPVASGQLPSSFSCASGQLLGNQQPDHHEDYEQICKYEEGHEATEQAWL